MDNPPGRGLPKFNGNLKRIKRNTIAFLSFIAHLFIHSLTHSFIIHLLRTIHIENKIMRKKTRHITYL